MNKKKTILTLTLSGALCLGGGTVFALAESDESVTFDTPAIESEYVENELFTLPTINAYVGGKEYATNAKVILPDGRICYAPSFPLEQLGEYSVVYAVNVDGKNYKKEYSFTVDSESMGLFSVTGGEVKVGQSDYSPYLYGAQFDMTASGVAEYEKVLNLSESTKNDCLVEFVVTAHEMNVSDFTQIEFTLTDLYDESNFIKIR